jgi:hypothetical protein
MFGQHGHSRHDGLDRTPRGCVIGCSEEIDYPIDIAQRMRGIDDREPALRQRLPLLHGHRKRGGNRCAISDPSAVGAA